MVDPRFHGTPIEWPTDADVGRIVESTRPDGAIVRGTLVLSRRNDEEDEDELQFEVERDGQRFVYWPTLWRFVDG